MDENTNFVSFAQLKSNDLLKVQRASLLCFDNLIKAVPKRLLPTSTGKDENKNIQMKTVVGERTRKKIFGKCSTVNNILFKSQMTEKFQTKLNLKG